MFKSKITEAIQKHSLASLFLVLLLTQNSLSAEDATKITTTSSGSIKLGISPGTEIKFQPTGATTEWQFSYGVKGQTAEGTPSYFTIFTPPKIKGTLDFTQKSDGIECTWNFQALEDCSFNTLALEFRIPVKNYANTTWKADDQKGIFPEKYTQSGLFGGNVSEFSVVSDKGKNFKLKFFQPTHLGIEDDRRWGGQNYKFRFGKVFGKLAKGEKYKVGVTITVPGKVSFDVDDEVTIRPGKDWVILKPELDIKPGSALDLSGNGLTKGPCGAKGRIIITPEGHFAFADDPKTPQRFYGANLCFTSQYMPKDKVDILLDRWLRFGYNTLRIHHYEFRLTKSIWIPGFDWDPKSLDQLSYLIAGCSKRGIWLTTDLFVSRPIDPKQIDVPNAKPYIGQNNRVDCQKYKALVLVHEPAFKDFLKFTEKLLNHVNPYTGKRLAEEPALAWINLVNEGPPGDGIKVLPEWKTAWNKWLAKRYSNREKLAKAIGDLQDNENPEAGTVEFPKDGVGANTPRARLCQIFMADIEKTFVVRVKKFLREKLKCQALISNHNCPPNFLADQGAREVFDYVDDHFYVDHPIFERGWGLPSRCPNTNPVRDGVPGTRRCAAIRVWGKPMTISEFNYSGPGRFRGVGAILTGSLAALQDWDVLWRFAYAHADQEIFQPAPMDYFNISRDPLSLAADRAAVMLFLRADLKSAPHRLALAITENELQNPDKSGNLLKLGKFDWVTQIGTSVKYIPKNAISIPLNCSDDTAMAKIKGAGITPEDGNGVVHSETGELSLDKSKGVFCVDTPRTAGGYADAGQIINATKGGVKVDKIKTGATVFVTSLNKTSIRTSSRLLVTHLTDLQNNGATYGESARQTLRKWGNLPYLVRDGEATVHISLANPSAYTIWALSVGGRRLEKIPAKKEGGTLSFTAKVSSAFGARMLYEITTDKEGADPEAEKFKVSKTATADILTFDKPFLFTYQGWKDKAVVKDSVANIQAETSKGGGGYNFNNGLDIRYMSNQSPVLSLTIGKNNKAKSVKVLFSDEKGANATFIYDIEGKAVGEPLRLFPHDNVSISKPNEGKSIDLGVIKQIQILGDWSENAVDLCIDKLQIEPVRTTK